MLMLKKASSADLKVTSIESEKLQPPGMLTVSATMPGGIKWPE